MNRIYFPLRSSIEFFEDPAGATPAARAKEGAVLFDRVVFEDGQIIVTVGEGMNLEMFRPRHQLTEEDLVDARPPAGPGKTVMLSVGTETTPGTPAAKMQTVGETLVTKAYTAQWHSAAIDELQALEVPWAAIATPSAETREQLAKPTEEATVEFKARAQNLGLSRAQIDFASKSLARDVVLAARLGASINLSSMFAPMVEGTQPEPTGSDALAFLVPNLEHLSWEAIAEHRERPGSVEARGLLREVEEKALAEEPGDAGAYLEKVKASITDGLAAALVETEVNVPEVVSRELVNLAVSFVPIAGTVIGPLAGVAAALGEQTEQRESGIFALVKLRRQG